MYLNSIYIGLKVLPMWIHWAQSIYYLGTWTLRDVQDCSISITSSGAYEFEFRVSGVEFRIQGE